MPSKTTRRRRPPGGPKASAGFPGQLREIIVTRRLSAHAVAASAGVAPSVVSRFLARERGLTLDTFDAIAGGLGLKLVEGGRGKGRTSRAARPATGEPSGIAGPDAPELLEETVELPAEPIEAARIEPEVSPMGEIGGSVEDPCDAHEHARFEDDGGPPAPAERGPNRFLALMAGATPESMRYPEVGGPESAPVPS
jgi:transcriptional regulator with XRE-family HTH domain